MEKSARNKLSSGKNLSFALIVTDDNNDARHPGESSRVSRERNSNDKSRRKDDRRKIKEDPLKPNSRKSRPEESFNNDIEIEAKSTHAKIAKDDKRNTALENTIDSISKKDQDVILPPALKTEKCPLCRKQFPGGSKMKHHRN